MDMIPVGKLYDGWSTGQLQRAPWQRNFVWSKKKQMAFIKTLEKKAAERKTGKGDGHLLSPMFTYRTHGSEIKKANDGSQRMDTVVAYMQSLDSDSRYAFYHNVLMETYIPVHHKDVADEFEALDDFKEVNAGTILSQADQAGLQFAMNLKQNSNGNNLTLYEYNIVVGHVKAIARALENACNGKTNKVRKGDSQKVKQDSYALFLRYIGVHHQGRASELVRYHVTNTKADNKETVEYLLSDWLQNTDADIGKTVMAFETQLLSHSTYIQEIWQSCMIRGDITTEKSGGDCIPENTMRFLLHTLIWRQNFSSKGKSLSLELMRKPIEKWLIECQGHCQVPGQRTPIARSEIDRWPAILKALNIPSDYFLDLGNRRNKFRTQPGKDGDHQPALASIESLDGFKVVGVASCVNRSNCHNTTWNYRTSQKT